MILSSLLSSTRDFFHKSREIAAITFREHPRLFWVSFSLYTFSAVIEFAQPYIFSKIFTLISSAAVIDERVWQGAIVWVGLLLASFLFGAFLASFAIRFNIEFMNYASKSLLSRMYEKLLYFDITLHESESSGKFLAKLRRSVDRIQGGLDIVLYQFAPSIAQILFVIGAMFVASPKAGFIFLLGFLLLFAYIIWTSVYLFRIFSEMFEKEGEIGAYFVETLSQIRTIRFFGQEHYYRESGDATFSQFAEVWKNRYRPVTWFLLLKFAGIYLEVGLLAVLAVYLYLTQTISAESFVFLVALAPLYLRALEGVSHQLHKLADTYASVDQYHRALSLEERVVDRHKTLPVSRDIEGQVEFRDVTFRYEGSERDQFINFSVSFTPKKTTAIVGPSGSGKSSLVKLLFRLYDVEEGAILVDGTDIRAFDQREYRRLLAIVPQEVEMFNASIRDNILLGDSYTDEEIWHALRLAVLDHRVHELPRGLDTEVGERGIKLSGGERQRLGIARALIRKPKILVLDEATSSLDTVSERLVKEAIYNLEHLNITVIVIAHRLSTIRDADEILVFDGGRVVERGTHDELMAQRGKYSELQGENALTGE